MKHIFKKNQIIITALAVMIAVAGYLNYSGTKLGNQAQETVAKDENAAKKDGNAKDTALVDIESLDADIEDLDTAEGETSASQDKQSADASDVVNLEDAAAKENTEASEKGGQTADAGLTDDSFSPDAGDVADNGAGTDSAAADSTDVEANAADTAGQDTSTPGEAVLTSSAAASNFAAEAKLSREQVRAKNKETFLEVINNANIEQEQKQNAVNGMNDLTEIAEREAAAELMLEAKGFTNSVVSITDNEADVVIAKAELSEAERAQIEDIVKRKTNVAGENIIITPMSVKSEEQ